MCNRILAKLTTGILLLFFPALFAPALFAQQDFGLNTGTLVRSSVLPAEDAFALSTFIEAPDTVVLLWEIKEGYYLYRKSIAVAQEGESPVDLGELPVGETITDEYFGEVAVYFDRLIHRFPMSALRKNDNLVTFTLNYQGCAKDRYCYPMQVRTVKLSLPD